jgi:hypothetical protein
LGWVWQSIIFNIALYEQMAIVSLNILFLKFQTVGITELAWTFFQYHFYELGYSPEGHK